MKDIILAVDVDGTIVEHKFPDLGSPVPKALFYLKQYHDQGAKIILNTMRSDEHLTDIINLLKSAYISLYGINNNPTQHK